MLVGAGGYALVYRENQLAHKVFYEPIGVEKEVALQTMLVSLFPQLVPRIYTHNSLGFEMTYLPPPLDFDEAVHMLLGYTGDDIDTSWGRTSIQPVSPNNPTRGFFASPETMEWIWKQEGSQMTLDKMASIMGHTYRVMLENGILPIDIEWIWSKGRPWMIDFGLCEEGHVDPATFLEMRGVRGLADDFYIPHPGQKGYEAFYHSFLQKSNE